MPVRTWPVTFWLRLGSVVVSEIPLAEALPEERELL